MSMPTESESRIDDSMFICMSEVYFLHFLEKDGIVE